MVLQILWWKIFEFREFSHLRRFGNDGSDGKIGSDGKTGNYGKSPIGLIRLIANSAFRLFGELDKLLILLFC